MAVERFFVLSVMFMAKKHLCATRPRAYFQNYMSEKFSTAYNKKGINLKFTPLASKFEKKVVKIKIKSDILMKN